MSQKNLKKRVLFNASVVLAGLKSKKGGSGILLGFAKKKKFAGIVSEIILDEILRHSSKLNLDESKVKKACLSLFHEVTPAPNESVVRKFKAVVIDEGDAHVLATASEEKVDYLVTLDKKHLLILKGKIKGLNILSPGKFLELLSGV